MRQFGKLERLSIASKSYPRIAKRVLAELGQGLPKHRFRYKTVAVGGTFDILHVGHEKLLARAFSLGERVLIGVSGDRLAESLRKGHSVNPFELRVRRLKRFLKSHDWIQRAKISELQDSFGPALKRKRLQALVVSTETRRNGAKLNRLRRRMRLVPLKIHVVTLARARNGRPISASRIRRGEIDRQGNLMKDQR